MLINDLKISYINSSTNHSETSCCILHVATWSSALCVWSSSSFAFKGTRTKWHVFTDSQKGTTLTCTKLSVGYFELKLHIHTLGTTETYFTYFKKGRYTTPLTW